MSLSTNLLRTAALVLLAACHDVASPVATPVATPPATTGPAYTPDAASGGVTTVQVQVPASMRASPFNVARSLAIPAGYGIAVYARVGGARFMATTPNGDLLVSNPGAGTVYRVRPGTNGADPTVAAWATGLTQPHDVVFHAIGGTMYVYVSETNRIARYTWNAASATAQNRQVLISGLPSVSDTALHGAYAHQLKNIALGPDDKLYVSIASSCNACVEDTRSTPVRGAIYVYNADGTNGRIFARGIRNAEGLAFVPGTNTLWAVVNNRDNTAYPFHRDFDGDGTDDYGKVIPAYVDNHPTDEYIHVTDGANFGWPFCNPNPDAGVDNMPFDRDVQLNPTGSQLDCALATRVDKGIQAHSAALGLTFLAGTRAPAALQGGSVVALHGSWNRTTPTGYKVVWFPTEAGTGRPGAQQDLVSGWTSGGSAWGRPVDAAVDSSGGILISDDLSGTIYRLAPVAAPTTAVALVGQQSGLCLDVSGATQSAGTRVLTNTCRGTVNQQWALPPSGTAGEIHVYDTMCLDAFGGSGTDGDAIGIWTCTGGANQRWTLTTAGEIRGMNGKCIDVAGQSTAVASAVVLWPCNGQANQKWAVP